MIGSLAALVAVALTPVQTPVAPVDLQPAEKLYGLSVFWKEASDHFAFFQKLPDLNWDAKYQEFIPRVLATKSTAEYYGVMREFAGLLRDSHTGIGDPPGLQVRPALVGPGVSVAWDEGVRRLWVFNVFERFAERIPVGSEIVRIEGKPLNEYLEERWGNDYKGRPEEKKWGALYSQALAGSRDEEARFTIMTPDGQTRDVGVPRRREAGDRWAWEAWPPRPEVEYRDLGGGIAYVALNSFRDMKTAEDFEKLIPTLKSAKGLILDLRNNGGGNDAVGARICKHLTTGPFSGFISRTREVKSAFKAWGAFVDPNAPNLSDEEKTRLDHYRGTAWHELPVDRFEGHKTAELLMPKVVLTGRGTASAAEDTLIYMGYIPNLSTVGQRTFGSTGQPLSFRLPGGGTGFVCTQHCRLPDGTEFMDVGIAPQVLVPATTVKERIAKKDSTMERGIEVLKAKL